jgi:hypothetical protein
MATQGDTEETIHANPDGMTTIEQCVAASVKKNTVDKGPGVAGGSVGVAPGATVVRTRPKEAVVADQGGLGDPLPTLHNPINAGRNACSKMYT